MTEPILQELRTRLGRGRIYWRLPSKIDELEIETLSNHIVRCFISNDSTLTIFANYSNQSRHDGYDVHSYDLADPATTIDSILDRLTWILHRMDVRTS